MVCAELGECFIVIEETEQEMNPEAKAQLDAMTVDEATINKAKLPKKYGPWKPVYTKILALTHRGHKLEYISQHVQMAITGIHRIQRRPDFIDRLDRMCVAVAKDEARRDSIPKPNAMERARAKINAAAFEAATTMVKLIKKPRKGQAIIPVQEKRILLEAAKDILDRAGLKPVEVIETRERVYTPEEVKSALNTIRELEHVVKRLDNTGNNFVLGAIEDVVSRSSATDIAHESVPPVNSDPPDSPTSSLDEGIISTS